MSVRSQSSRISVAVAVWIGLFVAGWATRPDAASAAANASPPPAGDPPAPQAASIPTADPTPTAAAAPEPSTTARPVLYPNMVLSAEEKDVLRMTPEQALAKGDLMGAAEQHRRRCQEMMGDQSEPICEKIDETMHHLRLADLKNLHEFLGGTMEPSKFQEQHHRNMVAWQLELEGYLSWDQLMRYPAIQAGDDPFLVVTAWGIGTPPGYTMGEDILARRPGAAPDENPPDDPRNPWTYGTKVAHGEKP